MKKDEIKVEKDFLLKMAKQIDDLTAKVQELKQKDFVAQNSIQRSPEILSKVDYRVTILNTSAGNALNLQREFIGKVNSLIREYQVVEFEMNYKKP